ncbi:MAG: cupredoxin domain-containing protein [Thermomicrobiales bacterium]
MLNIRKKPGQISGLLVAFTMVLAGAGTSFAQQATPANTGPTYPAGIYQGTCDTLGVVKFPLTDVSAMGMEAGTPEVSTSPVASGTAVSGGSANGMNTSATLIQEPLDAFSKGGYAIAVQESTENHSHVIACGNIEGTIAPAPNANQGRFIRIALHTDNDSGYSGVAHLQEKGTGTEVLIDLTTPGANGTPASATPTGGQAQAAVAVRVDIKNLAFSPSTITIPVGGTITWTNHDSTYHTVTAQDRKVLQSGTMNPGASYTQTFKKAGTYEYFCEFHANMKGTIIVK